MVSTSSLLDFLNTDAVFSIPLFQRPYSWDLWQCKVLWQDLERTARTGKAHFFGAIFFRNEVGEGVGTKSGGSIREISLIDGQQRTLTTFLLLSALADAAEVSSVDSQKTSSLNSGVPKKVLFTSDGKMRVKPSERDMSAFEAALFESARSAQGISSGDANKALENKHFFAKMIEDSDTDLKSLWDALEKFQIVHIELEPQDSAQRIFESFNSKGVPLVTADMVRNYLLLSKNPDDQKRLYENYWGHIQGLFGDDPGSLRLNNAIHAWTVIRCKTPHARSDAEAFDDFKQYFQNEYGGSVEDLLEELRSFCMVWAENYRYHAVKKFRSTDWAKLGRKTLVSGREVKPASQEARDFYAKHYGVNEKEGE